MRSGTQIEIAAAGFHPGIAKAASRGLHDAAQPLTIVQGLLELTLLQARSVEEYRESVEAALVEMARLGDCFERVREIVRLQQPASDVTVFRLSDLVALGLKEPATSGTDVHLLRLAGGHDLVEASYSRAQHALELMLAAALATGHKLEAFVRPQGETFVAVVRTAAVEQTLDEAARSSIELAQIVAASTGGRVDFSETPFSVSLVLPKAVMNQSADQKGITDHV
jgi:hypothetical protein